MQNRPRNEHSSDRRQTTALFGRRRAVSLGLAAVLLLLVPASPARPQARNAESANLTHPELPSLPQPQASAQQAPAQPAPTLSPCLLRRVSIGAGWGASAAAAGNSGSAAALGAAASLSPPTTKSADEIDVALVPCTTVEHVLNELRVIKKLPMVNWYARFLDGPQVKPMTPKEKGWLAVRNVADPFNALTILASSAIAVGSNANSAYGPGFTGFGRYVGVSYSQDMLVEFVGTFAIPSLTHEDPHYHRMPTATIKRRIAHTIYQVVWTLGDNGKGMINYSDVVGFAIDDEVGNIYIPGQEPGIKPTVERYASGLATAPIDNVITEFLPDIARKIHIRVVLIQHFVNQIANRDTTGGTS